MTNKQKELASKILMAANNIAHASRISSANNIFISSSDLIDIDLVYIGENKYFTKKSIYHSNIEFLDCYYVMNNDGISILEPKSNFISLREFNLDKLIDNQ